MHCSTKLFRYFISGILSLLFIVPLQAQINSIGTPFIKNYSRLDYRAGQQNWMIDQAEDGRIFFANNEGILVFDGLNWSLTALPKEIIVRSMLISDDERIYAGGFNEFGYFEPDSSGKLVYNSLVDHLLPEDRNFDEIWRIHETPDGIVFQSFTQLIIVNSEGAQVVKAPGNFHFSHFVNGQLLVVDLEVGILRYSMGNFFPLIGTESLQGLTIWAILPYGNQLLMATAEDGIYVYDGNKLEEWSNPASGFLKQNQVFSAIRLSEDLLAFGTIQKGLMICTNEGIPVQKISSANGLQNNTILCLREDNDGNLWLGTDNGIDYLEINSPLSTLSYEDGISAGYTATLFNGILYLGTNQGVFYKKWEAFTANKHNSKFELIEDTRGQVWTLQVIDDHLFCGNNDGTFIIRGSEAEKISDIHGAWTFLTHPRDKNRILAGTYSGLITFRKTDDKWSFENRVKGFSESSRLMEIDEDESIWMSHGFKGVFHIFLNDRLDSVTQVDFYNSSKGFNTDFRINVTRLKGGIYFSSSDGVYNYNPDKDLFEKNNFFNDLLQLDHLSRLIEDKKGNIWYFAHQDVGVLRLQEDGEFANINIPFMQIQGNLMGGFEFVYPVSEQNVLFGASHGFIHYSPGLYKDYQKPNSTYISEVRLLNPDSIIFSGHTTGIGHHYMPTFQYRYNALHFSFSANDFENSEKTEYSTLLEGFDENWTAWETRYSREFTNLREGSYNFLVKARNIYGIETEPASFQFQIAPPLARTITAYFIYSIFAILLIGLISFLIRKKIERSKQQEKKEQQAFFREREEKMQLDTLEAEKEIIRLRNEKLREEMITKDKELANSTLETIQKNKLLTKIKTDLKKLAPTAIDDSLKHQIQLLSKKINKELNTEKQWEVFETHFENVHEAFLKRLKTQYPELSPRELKLAAYLRLNISSKEIAVLMNISTRGVEISRYRLRKKLSLSRNENLTDFILSF